MAAAPTSHSSVKGGRGRQKDGEGNEKKGNRSKGVDIDAEKIEEKWRFTCLVLISLTIGTYTFVIKPNKPKSNAKSY